MIAKCRERCKFVLQTNRTYMTKRFLLIAALAALAISSCTKVPTGEVVLQGDITGDPLEVVVLSYLPGQSIGYHYPEVQDGTVPFDNPEYAEMVERTDPD